jgi:hypothetical protein
MNYILTKKITVKDVIGRPDVDYLLGFSGILKSRYLKDHEFPPN